jgi:hypothetical protein
VSYSGQRPRPSPRSGRQGAEYRAATAEVRERAKGGEPCWFWGRDPDCPGPGWDWRLGHNHRDAFTAHHLNRLMDGGEAVPDSRLMAPAHRGCNARDGLRAQNARRAGVPARAVVAGVTPERTSQVW